MDTHPDFRKLALADNEPAARVISQAFVDDPLCAFMLPFRRTRTATLYKFFRAYGGINIANGRGYGSGDPLQGVAFWKSADQPDLDIGLGALRTFVPLLFTFFPFGYYRARSIMRQTDALHKKYISGPHYYLDNLGVLPASRGQGVSSKLIRPILAQADEQRLPVFTDTVTRTNVALYEHFGFQSVEECGIAGTGITVWMLHRPAA